MNYFFKSAINNVVMMSNFQMMSNKFNIYRSSTKRWQ